MCLINELLKKQCNNIEYFPSKTLYSKGKLRELESALIDVKYLLKSNKDDICIYSYVNNRYSVYLLNCLSIITKKRILFCVHSELDVLTYKINNIFSWPFRIKFFYKYVRFSSNLRFLLFSKHIKNALNDYLPIKKTSLFYALDHPYFKRTAIICKSKSFFKSTDIHIGIAGGITLNRGLNELLDFLNLIKGHKILIYVISRISLDCFEVLKAHEGNNLILLNKTNEYVSSEIYAKYINMMDYLFYPYTNSTFKLSASGSVFEAVVYNKPIISYTNMHFSYLFKEYGEFGFLLDKGKERDILYLIETKHNYQKFMQIEDKIATLLNPKNVELNPHILFEPKP